MTQPQLTVHQDGSWFRVDDQQSVDLRTRSRYRVLLQMLVREHHRDPAATISVAAVIREVWPDERLRHTVARNRAYVALCSLRKWGLEGLLLRTPHGYQLDPKLHVISVDCPPGDISIQAGTSSASLKVALSAPDEMPAETAAFSDDCGFAAKHGFVDEPTVSTAEGRSEPRDSMRVRVMDMPETEHDLGSLRRLVG